jgi:hypothetical protein
MQSNQDNGHPGKERQRAGKFCPEQPFSRTFNAHYPDHSTQYAMHGNAGA